LPSQTHIHYGLGDQNPVARLRFFSKNSSGHTAVGKYIDERTYESILPRVFEDRKVRVFCRHHDKEYIARKAFEEWCRNQNTHAPFPTKCESPGDVVGFEDEADEREYIEPLEEGWTQFSQDN
jgi:hypothetical protein